MEAEIDYLKFYDDEWYLLNEVGPSFRRTGELDVVDFYMMLVWKSNRAKNYHVKRLKKIADGTLENAVSQIAKGLWTYTDRKQRLRLLMDKWWFSLPTASAILTLLFPDEFTVYDYRVRMEVGLKSDLSQRVFSDAMWAEYEDYQSRVENVAPSHLNLREKDRYLTARSIRKEAEADCIA
jgi:hypothetical protein